MEKQLLLEESGYTAILKTNVTYGDHQAMQAVLMSAAKGKVNSSTQEYEADIDASATIEWTFKKMLVMVSKFTKDDKEVQPTRKFLEDLPLLDGELLAVETDKILAEIKKKQEAIEAK